MSTSPAVSTWKELPDHARVWIYQSDRNLSVDEVSLLIESGRAFVNSWASHGQKMSASFDVFHQRFAVIMADEEQAMASGCSIDSSVHFIKGMETQIGVDFFNRMKVVYLNEERIEECSLSEIPALVSSGQLTRETRIFDNLVSDKLGFETKWMQAMSETWASRYFQ